MAPATQTQSPDVSETPTRTLPDNVASPPSVQSPDDDDSPKSPRDVQINDSGMPLLSGYVRLYPATQASSDAVPERVWLVATDLSLRVDGGRTSLAADDILTVGAVTAATEKKYRILLTVQRWKGPLPWLASPRASPPERGGGSSPSPLQRKDSSLLSLLSPLWKASRLSLLQRSSALRMKSRGQNGANGIGGGLHQQPGSEYILEADTPWEAEAWAMAISESRAALVHAAEAERWSDVSRLLAAGRHANGREANGRSALHYAAGHGAKDALDELLNAGASAALVDNTGLGALGMAAMKSRPAVIDALLDAGADPLLPAKAGTLTGKTAVDMARLVGSDECASVLLSYAWFNLLPFTIMLR